ncbi:AC4 protein [Vernonia crinkle virus]|uniref:AC4 protein n=1 Tax=Vernonia crinkle virus TaxID=1925153 RepID=A0A1L4AB12_9GEMI|nr:AC4 protein [Vernonia crinkle virus]API65471.1 AC4 protein [Vernonia crinkle virus]API65478.1 AC4 protein [Vernonia crinkle virus]
MKMGNLIYTCSSNSKENSSAETTVSSTSTHLIAQPNSILTSRELSLAPMLNPTWKKTETCLIMEFSRSMDDLLEEVARMPTTHMPRHSIQGLSHRPSIY